MIPQPLLWWAVTRYAWMYGRADSLGVRLRGLGWLLRRMRTDHVLDVEGVRLWFDHRVASSYDRLVAGELNEPETAAFLGAVLEAFGEDVTFVDVGANVGELLIPLAAHPRVVRAIGFEPQPACADACERSAALNGFAHVRVRRELVADGAPRRFSTNVDSPNTSAIADVGDLVKTVKLDDALADVRTPLVLLVDVEGAEPLVLSGAATLLRHARPLVVFEYNFVSRRHYRLDDVRARLGSGYDVLRLRRDGRLDAEVEDSWNCVAVPRGTRFEEICTGLAIR